MALIVADRVKSNTTTTGAGTVVLSNIPPVGYQSFAVIGDANTTYYTIAEQSGSDWEVGIGTYYLANSSLARTTILASSNANAVVTFGSGTKDVFVTYPAEQAVYLNDTGGTSPALGNTNVTSVTFSDGSKQTTAPYATNSNNSVFVNNTNITGNVTISTGQNGLTISPINIPSGNSISISNGQKLVII
jgi:hypothetical protein